MNNVINSLTKLEQFGKDKTALTVLTEVFQYPKINVLGAYNIKITNELELNLDLTKNEKSLLAKYKLALENIISNVRKPLDEYVSFSNYIKQMSSLTDNADKRALAEVMPNRQHGKLLNVHYDNNGRLIINPAYSYDELTRTNNYVIDKYCDFNLISKTFEDSAIRVKGLAFTKNPRQQIFKNIYRYQEVRTIIANNVMKLLRDNKLDQVEVSIKFFNAKPETIDNKVQVNFSKNKELSKDKCEAYDVEVYFED